MKRLLEKGFTLIELVMVIAIVGILSAIALPKFVDLSQNAKIAAVKGNLSAIRSVLAIQYAQNAATGSAGYPTAMSTAFFADGQFPKNPLQATSVPASILVTAAVPSGTAVSAAGGYWFITGTGASAGRAGAFSNGTIDTSTF